jgi:hypothetical protein
MVAEWMGSRGMENASEIRKAGGEAGKPPGVGGGRRCEKGNIFI